uniref:CABIT domain-containing protein n=2 Tax=Cacopsylla melanoneura TaxID=428564 RepID=A0A8D8XBL9_9HEMI
MIINNWFKDGIMNKNKNNNKWNNSAEREIMINDEENISCTELNEKLFFTRTYSLNNSDTYGTPNNLSSATMNSNSNSNNICQTMNSSGSSSCDNSTQQHLTPKQFLEKYSLPRVIKIIPQEPIADSCGNFDPITLLSGQLLMYKHYNSGKVEARSFPNDRKDYSSLFVIPETYKGWFSVVTERGQIKARMYSSIQRLVSAQVTVFLTVSQDLPAYIQTNSDEISTQYTKTSVKSGQVLKLLAVYQDLNSNQSTKSKRLSWPLIGSKQHTSRYAQCLSSSNQVLFINFNTPGQFYAVSMTHNSTEENVTKVYQIQKLLRTFPLPVRVTIIGSNKNHGNCSMLLENYHKEHVVLSCVLDGADVTANDTTSEKFRLLEIDVNSKFYVVKPGGRDIDERRLFYSPLVQRAMKFCNDNSEQWISQLKVIHHIYPQNSNQILANQPHNVSIEKSKKVRKTSICDKITVKSASFRYSTSYGNEAPRPLIKKQDLEKPTKPKVYDFNYKQTHEFLSLSSNATKDSTHSSHENSLHSKNDSALPDVSYDRMYVRSNTRNSQDSRGNDRQKPANLPFANGSTQSTSEINRERFHFLNNQRRENMHDSINTQETSNHVTSLPTKNYSQAQNSSQETRIYPKVSSLPGRDPYENKRLPSIQHHYPKHNGHEELKKNISRSSPIATPMLPDQNEVPKEEISPVERLDRLTQSCNLLSLLNKTNNSYQNVSSNQSKQNMYKTDSKQRDMHSKDTNESSDSDSGDGNSFSGNRGAVNPNLEAHVKDPSDNQHENVETQAQGSNNNQETLSLQQLHLNRTSSPKQNDNKQFYKPRSNESTPFSYGFKAASSTPVPKNKLPERTPSYMHRQQIPDQGTSENKPFSIQSNIFRSNSSRNSSPVENNQFSRNQSFNHHNFIPNHTSTSSYQSNSSQYSNQNVRPQVMKSSSNASSHSNSTNYQYNNQNKYPFNVSRNSSVKTSMPPPIKTHNKTPVPMPRLNVSYAKVHDAIDDHNETGSASSENIYAEISDR